MGTGWRIPGWGHIPYNNLGKARRHPLAIAPNYGLPPPPIFLPWRPCVALSVSEFSLFTMHVCVVCCVTDPRVWSRLDVHNWLESMRRSRDVDIDSDRFRMNGKALCLMTRNMFTYRVPRGGLVLYADFQTRLCRAVALALHCSVVATAHE